MLVVSIPRICFHACSQAAQNFDFLWFTSTICFRCFSFCLFFTRQLFRDLRWAVSQSEFRCTAGCIAQEGCSQLQGLLQ